jgi:hypothetical protein
MFHPRSASRALPRRGLILGVICWVRNRRLPDAAWSLAREARAGRCALEEDMTSSQAGDRVRLRTPPGAEQTAMRPIPAAAQRALAEAAARRAERERAAGAKANEQLGREGLDPTRYGDWEVKGIASDF